MSAIGGKADIVKTATNTLNGLAKTIWPRENNLSLIRRLYMSVLDHLAPSGDL